MKSMTQFRLSALRFRRVAAVSTITLTSALMAWCALSGPVTAAMLAPKQGEEAGPKDWPADPTKHEIVIKREATDAKQSAMITAAEAAQANKEALRKEAAIKDPNVVGNELALPDDDKVWWYQQKLGMRIPYAITSDAITYYSEVVAKNGKKAFKSYMQPSSRLDYHASVKSHKEFKFDNKTFKDVNVVTLELSFSANFTAEATSGLSFVKKRIVVLDAANKVLYISGDGPTEALIMMI